MQTNTRERTPNKFIEFLKKNVRHNRASLAHLRRSMAQTRNADMIAFPILNRWVPANQNRDYERAVRLVGGLFAFYPEARETTFNFGASLSMLAEDSNSVEKRLNALLATKSTDLAHPLRQLISLLNQKNKPVNWDRLFWDIYKWDNEDRIIQRQWAAGFWAKGGAYAAAAADLPDSEDLYNEEESADGSFDSDLETED